MQSEQFLNLEPDQCVSTKLDAWLFLLHALFGFLTECNQVFWSQRSEDDFDALLLLGLVPVLLLLELRIHRVTGSSRLVVLRLGVELLGF